MSRRTAVVEARVDERAPVRLPLPPHRPPGYRAAAEVVARLRRARHSAYLVGGGVRDLVMGEPPKDFDVVTSAKPEEIQRLFRRTIPIGVQFGVVTVLHRGRQHEVATYRAEGDYHDARRPGWIAFADLQADLERRDFTINGLVLDPEREEVLDWVGGLADLRRGIIRTIGRPDDRLREDALRIVRAVRFAARYGFRLEPETRRALVAMREEVRKIAAERVWQELEAMWAHRTRAAALALLADVGLLRVILPEVAALADASSGRLSPWRRTLRRVEGLPPAAPNEVVWAAVLADVASPSEPPRPAGRAHALADQAPRLADETAVDPEAAGKIEPILERLRAPRRMMRAVDEILSRRWLWSSADAVRVGELARHLRRDQDGWLPMFSQADAAAAGRPDASAPLPRIRRRLLRRGRMVLGPERPPITGDDLVAAGIAPGPRFQTILAAMERDWLEDRIETPEEARRWLADSVARLSLQERKPDKNIWPPDEMQP